MPLPASAVAAQAATIIGIFFIGEPFLSVRHRPYRHCLPRSCTSPYPQRAGSMPDSMHGMRLSLAEDIRADCGYGRVTDDRLTAASAVFSASAVGQS